MKTLSILKRGTTAALCLLTTTTVAGAQGWKPTNGAPDGSDPKSETPRGGDGRTFSVPLEDGSRLTVNEDGRATLSDGEGKIIYAQIGWEAADKILKKQGRSINEFVPAEVTAKPRPTQTAIEPTAKGTKLRFSDGSTIELRPDVEIHSLSDGTKIEKLPEGTIIVRWPDGKGFVRNADGTAADITPDGSIVPAPGKIEVLPTGVIRRTLKDDGVVLDQFPDGTTRSRPDLAAGLPKTVSRTEKPMTFDLPVQPRNGQILLDSKITTRSEPTETVLGGGMTAAPKRTSPSTSAEVKEVPALQKMLTSEPSKPVALVPLNRPLTTDSVELRAAPSRATKTGILK